MSGEGLIRFDFTFGSKICVFAKAQFTKNRARIEFRLKFKYRSYLWEDIVKIVYYCKQTELYEVELLLFIIHDRNTLSVNLVCIKICTYIDLRVTLISNLEKRVN